MSFGISCENFFSQKDRIMNSSKKINVKCIKLVRSAKDNDMLLVDGYFYYYEDRGQNTFRWVCAKRRVESCRARLVTTPTDNDKLEHEVIRIVGEHCHDKNTKEQIEKAIERKERADEDGKPGTLSSKLLERKIRKLSQALGETKPERKSNDDSKSNLEDDGMKKIIAVQKQNNNSKNLNTPRNSFEMFKYNEVYLLKTRHERELVCVNGFLYRLEGKSKTSATFRWECIRSDVNCKIRIYTECFDKKQHILRPVTGATTKHDHDGVTPKALLKMVEKYKMNIIEDTNIIEDLGLKFDKIPKALSSPPYVQPKEENTATLTSCVTLDPLDFNSHLVYSKSILNKKKILMLPSAKGNQVLCLDNMIYHYDSPSPCRKRIYWTCMLRRNKHYKCNARLITENTDDGLEIKKMSGKHEHPDHSNEIKQRINKANTKTDSKAKKNTKYNAFEIIEIPDEDSISSCDSTFSDDLHPLPQNLEDMREKRVNLHDYNLESPERINFVEKTNTNLFESEYNYHEMIISNEKPDSSKHGHKRKIFDEEIMEQCVDYKMDSPKITQLRSVKGNTFLNVDGYIYQLKRQLNERSYWMCVKALDETIKCKNFITTNNSNGQNNEIQVISSTNKHNHSNNENDHKKLFSNELIANGEILKKITKRSDCLSSSLYELQNNYDHILISRKEDQKKIFQRDSRKMKLYGVSDGPPSLAVRMTFKALNIPFELISVDYVASEHMTKSYAEMNPQKEIPVLDDNGFYLSESIAIMQYLCDKYAPDSDIYPKDPTARALVNHRLCFNMGFYYASISMHAMAPIFFDYPRNEMSLKKVNNALSVFETYLKRTGTKYAAANHVTLADFALVSATLCLEGIEFDLNPYPLVKNWYETFKRENPTLWEIGNGGMQEIATFDKNPPDLSHMNHPFHPTRPSKS